VRDLVGEAIADARHQGASVVFATEPEVAQAVDGLAALLRFREREAGPLVPGAPGP